MSFFQALLSQKKPLNFAYGSTILLDKESYRTSENIVLNQILYSPIILWRDGKTFVALRMPEGSPWAKPTIVQYDENLGVSRAYVAQENSGQSDDHPQPVIGFDDLGYLYVIQETPHNTPLRISKSNLVNDITGGFTTLPELIGTSFAYPNVLELPDGTKVVYARATANYEIYIAKSANDDFTGWGAQARVSQASSSIYRHYVSVPYDGYNNGTGWVYVHMSIRNDASVPANAWWKHHILKTQDFTTFWNLEETQSRNYTVSLLNEAFWDYGAYKTGANNNVQLYKPCTCVSPTGTFYAINGDGSTGYEFCKYETNGTKTYKVPTGFGTLRTGTNVGKNSQDSPFVMMYYRAGALTLYVRESVSGNTRLNEYTSVDGETWTFVRDAMDDTPATSFYYCGVPFNMGQIPNNRNFLFVANELNTTVSSINNMYVRPVAIGSLRTPVIPAVVPFTSSLDLTWQILIETEVGKITTSGATLTGVTDQSGNGRTITVIDAPAWSSADSFITFDGVNDRLNIATAGISTLGNFSFIAVFRKRTTQTVAGTSVLLSYANTASATAFGQIGTHNTYGDALFSQYRNGANATTDANLMHSGAGVKDANFHCVMVHIDKGKQTRMFVDGVERPTTLGAGTLALEGRGMDQIASLNNISIGALVRSTSTFTDFDLRAWGIVNGIVPLAQYRRLWRFYQNKGWCV